MRDALLGEAHLDGIGEGPRHSGIAVSTTAPAWTACTSSGMSCGRLMTPKVIEMDASAWRQCS